MRIVSGKYKGKRFSPPKNFPSRPTTDFAKESLFNILSHQIEFENLEVLDLCAGTGSISVEFLSRDAAHVTSVDKHPVSVKFMYKMKQDLQAENWDIIKSDIFEFIDKTNLKFDLIFADPPFDLKATDDLPEKIFEKELLKTNGLLIIEHGREHQFENRTHFTELRNYGGVQFSFFEL